MLLCASFLFLPSLDSNGAHGLLEKRQSESDGREKKEKEKKKSRPLSSLSFVASDRLFPSFFFSPSLPTSFQRTMASIRMAAPCGVASRSGGVSPKVRLN